MQLRKLIQRRIRRSGPGLDLAGDLNAVIAANVGERSQTTRVSSRSEAVSTATREERGGNGQDTQGQHR